MRRFYVSGGALVAPARAAVDFASFANRVDAVAVTAGVRFAAAQIRGYRRRDAMLDLVRSFQARRLQRRDPDLVAQAAPLRRGRSRDEEHATVCKWLQWLAERMTKHEQKAPPRPAHLAHRDWHAT